VILSGFENLAFAGSEKNKDNNITTRIVDGHLRLGK
jgi:hypothetical protein